MGGYLCILVSLRPARKLDDHEGDLMWKMSKRSSKMISCEEVSRWNLSVWEKGEVVLTLTPADGIRNASTKDRNARMSNIDKHSTPVTSGLAYYDPSNV